MAVDNSSQADVSISNDDSKSHVIIRRKVNSNFTVLDNALIVDRRLSWKALGLLTFLLSLPPNFRLRLNHLATLRPTGRDATRAGLRELEDAGYLSITVERHLSGRFSTTTWQVTDSPSNSATTTDAPRTENPNTANAISEKPKAGNPTLTNTKKKQEQIVQTTTPNEEPGGELIYPKVNELQKQQLAALMERIPASIRQDVLDELEAKRKAGKLKANILALARHFVANLDKFALADGLELREQRAAATALETREAMQKEAAGELQREAEAKLKLMSDEQFMSYAALLPPSIRMRVSKSRETLHETKS